LPGVKQIQGNQPRKKKKEFCHMTFYQKYFHVTGQMSEKNEQDM